MRSWLELDDTYEDYRYLKYSIDGLVNYMECDAVLCLGGQYWIVEVKSTVNFKVGTIVRRDIVKKASLCSRLGLGFVEIRTQNSIGSATINGSAVLSGLLSDCKPRNVKGEKNDWVQISLDQASVLRYGLQAGIITEDQASKFIAFLDSKRNIIS